MPSMLPLMRVIRADRPKGNGIKIGSSRAIIAQVEMERTAL